ncbi:Hypothetical_protein [Hexamita inflata]|uniref:Hypothetical_protein n=1 Tax=Hexamita inflata TaxID=28002 RepID=A0AA86QF35_9EUKA|nr:Hypothetical protein HINF_LOCUS45752 [Hexamita inflata]CAI9958109.1 Hypothetical protein HINF_LOCUS45754 [Hexamita inflata]CAI9958111.1 Hypothetical protein HINF_LOCUS45756 [Hexamita inflata]
MLEQSENLNTSTQQPCRYPPSKQQLTTIQMQSICLKQPKPIWVPSQHGKIRKTAQTLALDEKYARRAQLLQKCVDAMKNSYPSHYDHHISVPQLQISHLNTLANVTDNASGALSSFYFYNITWNSMGWSN